MAFVLSDRVKETTTTTGTGDITLAGAVSGFETFGTNMSNTDVTRYCIQGGTEWEIGIGTWNTGGTLTRTAVLQSSNSDSLVNFSAGTKTVFMTADSSYFMPTGSIVPYAGTAAPTGFLLCFGQALNASTSPQYQALYEVIGNTYGGSDNTDFVVPDLRGRVVAGQDDMGGTSADRLTDQSGGLDGDTLGDTGGAETHQLTESELAAHSHGIENGNDTIQSGAGSIVDIGESGAGVSESTESAGGDGAHNNVQPTIILNHIIKT